MLAKIMEIILDFIRRCLCKTSPNDYEELDDISVESYFIGNTPIV